MSDYASLLPLLETLMSQPEAAANEIFDMTAPAAIYGYRKDSSGLIWCYQGGRWSGFLIANGEVTLTASSTNYIVVALGTGAVSTSTTDTNWNNTGAYARAYKVTTDGSGLTGWEDHRAGLYGVSSASSPSPAGKHAVPVSAAAMRPSATGGCAPVTVVTLAANRPDLVYLAFDPTTQEYAQFSVAMPLSWNEGTFTFEPIWSHDATTTNFGVVWDLQAVAIGNDDTINAAFGTAQTSTDTGGTTDDLYTGPESAAITAAGTPQAKDVVHFRLSRVTGDGGDTLAIDARLHGIVLYMTTDTGTDA